VQRLWRLESGVIWGESGVLLPYGLLFCVDTVDGSAQSLPVPIAPHTLLNSCSKTAATTSPLPLSFNRPTQQLTDPYVERWTYQATLPVALQLLGERQDRPSWERQRRFFGASLHRWRNPVYAAPALPFGINLSSKPETHNIRGTSQCCPSLASNHHLPHCCGRRRRRTNTRRPTTQNNGGRLLQPPGPAGVLRLLPHASHQQRSVTVLCFAAAAKNESLLAAGQPSRQSKQPTPLLTLPPLPTKTNASHPLCVRARHRVGAARLARGSRADRVAAAIGGTRRRGLAPAAVAREVCFVVVDVIGFGDDCEGVLSVSGPSTCLQPHLPTHPHPPLQRCCDQLVPGLHRGLLSALHHHRAAGRAVLVTGGRAAADTHGDGFSSQRELRAPARRGVLLCVGV